mgnify:FL=1
MYCHGRRSFPRIHVTPPRRKRRRLLILTLVVSLAVNVLLLATRGGPKVGQWRSTSARETYLAAYREVAASMPAAQERNIATSWGTVHVALFPGPEGSTKAPILLLPGWGAGIPMWRDLLPVLARERPVYAVDALGDAGLSTQSVPLGKPEANAGWISETLTALEAPPVHVVGHSFGGWLATNFALHHPEQTVSLSLFDPVQTFSTLTWEVYLWAIPASIPLLPQSWRDAALARISGNETIDHNDPLTRLIDAGTKGYSSARDLPQQFTSTQLGSLSVPVYAAMAGNSTVLADPPGAVRRAEEFVPTVEASVWEGATHSLPLEEPEKAGAAVLDFMNRHEHP